MHLCILTALVTEHSLLEHAMLLSHGKITVITGGFTLLLKWYSSLE